MIATITPSRGDRPKFMGFCTEQLLRMNPRPNYFISVVNPPTSAAVDIVPRIKQGIEVAKINGYDNVYIIEDDDHYVVNYLDLMSIGDYDLIGYDNTTYYNLRTRRYQKFYHETHSSLFTTAFKISALDQFTWPADNAIFLDTALWRYAKQHNKKWKLLSDENPCLGIKHGIGMTGGKGHSIKLRDEDPNLHYLKSRVDEKAFEFYSNLEL